MNKNHFVSRKKKGDYVIICDTCGQKCWYSQCRTLEPETGLGTAVVCPNCVDGIYWGSVPFKVEAEENVPIVKASPYDANPESIPDKSDPANLDFTKILTYNKPNDEIP